MADYAPHPVTPAIDMPGMRRAGPDLLSLALMDARNHTLDLLSRLQDALGSVELRLPGPLSPSLAPPRWLAGHIGWFAEYWITRNTQRAQGIDCAPRPTRLAALDPGADMAWNPEDCPPQRRSGGDVPGMTEARAYLLETLEGTLELLEHAEPTDAGLYFYRLALFHEDLRGEQLLRLAQDLGLSVGVDSPPVGAMREPLRLPAMTWTLGAGDEPGFCWAQESGAQPLAVPEFEIDAQPVSWQQYAEFVADGGYDNPELWQPEGWAWVQAQGRRAPRHVDQIGAGGAVLLRRFGRPVHAAGAHAAQHLSWWEADAWARWAGRRLPTEAEWEVAAITAARRGFRWGEVHEWVAGRLQPWPGFRADPWSAGTEFDPQPAFGNARVLRGASFASRARAHHARGRAFAAADSDIGFTGFRTCAI
ncbi:MAG: hypothetical protein EOO29_03905 [Comamonadaceae bacterium]|nr:MAG: hypothetical protein EOO29_03905 [Comamonadaceae bacterium]